MNFNRDAAKAAGYTDDEINEFLGQQQPQAAPVTVSNSIPQSPLTNIANTVMSVPKALFPAAERLGKGLGTGLAIATTSEDDLKSREANLNAVGDLQEKAVEMLHQGKMEQAKKLLQLAKDQNKMVQDQIAGKTKDVENVETDLAKGAVGTAANFVPGAGTVMGRIGSGVVQGAAQGYASSENGQELPSIVGGATVGGATTAGMEAVGKVVGAAGKAIGNKLQKTGEKIQDSTAKIRTTPMVGGAQKEEQINNTLRELNITGTADEKYKKLQPVMSSLETDIQNILDANSKPVSIKKIQDDFVKNVKSVLATSDMSEPQAKKIIDKYIQDIGELSGNTLGDATDTPTIFRMKQIVNEHYGQIQDKIDKGVPLTSKEQIIAQARQTLDDVISEAHPDVKAKTLQQSNLFDSARSLARSRDNPPTLRAFGVSVPSFATQQAFDKGGQAVSNAGKIAQTTGELLPDILSNPVVQKGVIGNEVSTLNRPIETLPDVGAMGQQPQNTDQNAVGTVQNSSNNSNQNTPQFKYTTAQLMEATQNALADGNTKAAAQLKSMLDLQMKYEKSGSTKQLSAQAQKDQTKAKTGIAAMKRIVDDLNKDPNALIMKLNPLDQSGRAMDADMKSAIDIIGYFRTGATLTPQQRKDYISMFPSAMDSTETKQQKIQAIVDELKGYAGMQSDIPQYNQTLPDITDQGGF